MAGIRVRGESGGEISSRLENVRGLPPGVTGETGGARRDRGGLVYVSGFELR
jgi:hypothetical protein